MRAAIYARISKDTEGTELGVTRQQADCRVEAERRGWIVTSTYVDNDVSATRSKSRPEYQRMIRDVEAGKLDAILVWAVDRLTRSPRELEDIIDLADKHGVKFANVGGTIDLSTPEGRAMARQMGTFARLEVENMSKRLKRKFQEKAEKGEPHGYSPYGFRRVNGRDVANETEAAIVREAAERILRRESLRSVVADFNARGIHGPKSASWNSTILRQILLRPTNAGLRRYQGRTLESVRSTGDTILSESTHAKLVALLKDPSRRSNSVGPGYKYLLSGIAKCGRCGGTMRRAVGRTTLSKVTGATKRQPPAYHCSSCFRVRRIQEPIDELVTSIIIQRLSQPDAHELFASHGDASAAQEAQAEILNLNAKLDAVADQYIADEITGEQMKRINAGLRKLRDQAERALRAAEPNTLLAEVTRGDVAEKWEQLPVLARRELVESLLTVTIMPSGSGKVFDPEDVVVEWLTT